MRSATRPLREAATASGWVVRTGRSERIETSGGRGAGPGVPGEEHLRVAAELELSSALAVPLTVGEQTLGALVLLSSHARAALQPDGSGVRGGAGGAAALALDNARLFQEAQQALELIGIASHDLGNPLNALQLLLAGCGGWSRSASLSRCARGWARRCGTRSGWGSCLHNLLDLSRLSSGKLSLEVSRVELSEVVREVMERHAEQAREAGCRASLEADEAMEGCWDRLRLERVVTNPLNALKFGRGKPVECPPEAGGGRCCITVRDHGPGIPPEAQRRIFERFERENPRPAGGLRAGALHRPPARRSARGHLRVESTPGEGAAFTVELPNLRQVSEEPSPGPPRSLTEMTGGWNAENSRESEGLGSGVRVWAGLRGGTSMVVTVALLGDTYPPQLRENPQALKDLNVVWVGSSQEHFRAEVPLKRPQVLVLDFAKACRVPQHRRSITVTALTDPVQAD